MCETVPQATPSANTGSSCGLGCILASEHVKCSLTLRLNKVNRNEHLVGGGCGLQKGEGGQGACVARASTILP